MDAKRSNGSGLSIPVVDISVADEASAADLVEAVARYGFVFVRGDGTGFTKLILDNAFKLVKTQQYLPRWTDNANNRYSHKGSSPPPQKRKKNALSHPM